MNNPNLGTSVLSGWHQYRVWCNGWLIASFPTEAMRNAFIRERQARYPRSEYATA